MAPDIVSIDVTYLVDEALKRADPERVTDGGDAPAEPPSASR